MSNVEKIQVTFNEEQLKELDKYLGIFGSSRAEVLRHIVTQWMFEKHEK